MIKELRIGNWYNHISPHDTQPCQMQAHMFDLKDEFWDRVYPILVDEKWLLKFGFTKTEKDDFDLSYNFPLISGNIIIELERCFVLTHKIIIARCKYVHQLQNLYFAITQEELKFI